MGILTENGARTIKFPGFRKPGSIEAARSMLAMGRWPTSFRASGSPAPLKLGHKQVETTMIYTVSGLQEARLH